MNINNKLRFRDTTPDQVGNCTFWFLRRSQEKNEVQEGILSEQQRNQPALNISWKLLIFFVSKPKPTLKWNFQPQ